MPRVNFERIISVSSEDSLYKAENLLNSKKWRSENPGEQQVSVVIQLSKLSQINGIDIGTFASAFVEVQVSRQAGDPHEFRVILVASSFLTPLESRNENNLARVRMFDETQLNKDIAKEKWDIIKVVCTQPFNKSLKFGLSFINIHSAEEPKVSKGQPSSEMDESRLGAFRLKKEDESTTAIGSLFKKKFNNGSIANDLRSEETLASIALQSTEAEKKRKASDDSAPTPKRPSLDKEKRKIKVVKALPKRNVLDVEDKPKSPVTTKEAPKKKAEVKRPVVSKPFGQFMSDVVFTISGFQNPLRGNIRQKAIEMGAKYRGDWDNSCTHLVCAFTNTPKFNQVRGKGKIVTKDWIEKSHSDRTRYPWRRFCLDKKDRGEESEDEIQDESRASTSKAAKVEAEQDTDDELDKLKSEQERKASTSNGARVEYEQDTDDELEELKAKQETKPKRANTSKGANVQYEQDTDDEIEQLKNNGEAPKQNHDNEDNYEADTDIEEESLPKLPEFFHGKHFFIFGPFKSEPVRNSILRGIVAGGGEVHEYMSPQVNYVITHGDCDKGNFQDARKVNPEVLFLRPSFIQDCFDADKLISPPSSAHVIYES